MSGLALVSFLLSFKLLGLGFDFVSSGLACLNLASPAESVVGWLGLIQRARLGGFCTDLLDSARTWLAPQIFVWSGVVFV